MKLVKMSLAAAVLLGSSAFALDNVKVDGDARVYYGTSSETLSPLTPKTDGMWGKDNSMANAALHLNVTGDLTKGVSFGVSGIAVSTLGLENNLVSNTWSGAHGFNANGSNFGVEVNDKAWMSEAWIAGTVAKTTAKVGRMKLDTPFAYSETWSVAENTFDAAVLVNQDVPDTTLVGAWVGKGNGVNATGVAGLNADNSATVVGVDGILGLNASYGTFAKEGAYAAAVVNNSFKPLVAQAWYYNVVNIADAFWLQADWDCQLVKGVKVGVQFAEMKPKGLLEATFKSLGASDDSKAYAVKLAYEGVKNLNVSAAYSKADEDGVLKIANVATNNLNAAESKLYTEAFWTYGFVGAPGAKSWNAKAEYDAGIATVAAQYTDVQIGNTNAVNQSAVIGNLGMFTGLDKVDMKETAVSVSKAFGPLNATLAYFNQDFTWTGGSNKADNILAMLKVKF